jgi:hypothetical protein
MATSQGDLALLKTPAGAPKMKALREGAKVVMLGDAGGDAWLAQIRPMIPAMGGMTRVALTPEWVAIIDFEQRFPSAIEQAIATASAGAA